MTRTWRRWTTDDDTQLRALVADGSTEREIAAMLNRTLGAVGERKATLGLVVSKELPWTADEEHRLMEMLEAHHGHDAIAAALGRTRGAVFARAAVRRAMEDVTIGTASAVRRAGE